MKTQIIVIGALGVASKELENKTKIIPGHIDIYELRTEDHSYRHSSHIEKNIIYKSIIC